MCLLNSKRTANKWNGCHQEQPCQKWGTWRRHLFRTIKCRTPHSCYVITQNGADAWRSEPRGNTPSAQHVQDWKNTGVSAMLPPMWPKSRPSTRHTSPQWWQTEGSTQTWIWRPCSQWGRSQGHWSPKTRHCYPSWWTQWTVPNSKCRGT